MCHKCREGLGAVYRGFRTLKGAKLQRLFAKYSSLIPCMNINMNNINYIFEEICELKHAFYPFYDIYPHRIQNTHTDKFTTIIKMQLTNLRGCLHIKDSKYRI